MFDGNGNWTSDFSAQADRDNGIKILASRFDNIFIADIKESFENCLTKDGQIAPIGNFNMGGQKITNLNAGVNDNDAVNMSQLNNAVHKTGNETIGGIKTFTNAVNLANGTWNSVGDDSYFGDSDVAGGFCIKGNNASSRIALFDRNSSYWNGFYIDELDGMALKVKDPAKGVYWGSVTSLISQNLSGNGYVKYSNGLIIQWGNNSSTTVGRTISFPTAFSDTNYGVSIVSINSSVTGDYTNIIQDKTSTGFKANTNKPISWVAIGY